MSYKIRANTELDFALLCIDAKCGENNLLQVQGKLDLIPEIIASCFMGSGNLEIPNFNNVLPPPLMNLTYMK